MEGCLHKAMDDKLQQMLYAWAYQTIKSASSKSNNRQYTQQVEANGQSNLERLLQHERLLQNEKTSSTWNGNSEIGMDLKQRSLGLTPQSNARNMTKTKHSTIAEKTQCMDTKNKKMWCQQQYLKLKNFNHEQCIPQSKIKKTSELGSLDLLNNDNTRKETPSIKFQFGLNDR